MNETYILCKDGIPIRGATDILRVLMFLEEITVGQIQQITATLNSVKSCEFYIRDNAPKPKDYKAPKYSLTRLAIA